MTDIQKKREEDVCVKCHGKSVLDTSYSNSKETGRMKCVDCGHIQHTKPRSVEHGQRH